MKQFSLKEYLANPSRKVVTRDGNPVRIICTDVKDKYPIVGVVDLGDNREDTYTFKQDGAYLEGCEDVRDLFFAPERKEGWVNLYRTADGDERLGCFRHTEEEEEARMEASGDNMHKYIATIKLEWED